MYKSAPGLRYRRCDLTALCGGRLGGKALTGHPTGGPAAAKRMMGVTAKMTGLGGNSFPGTRMRRMRRDEFSRRLMRETHLSVDSLNCPIFVVGGRGPRPPRRVPRSRPRLGAVLHRPPARALREARRLDRERLATRPAGISPSRH